MYKKAREELYLHPSKNGWSIGTKWNTYLEQSEQVLFLPEHCNVLGEDMCNHKWMTNDDNQFVELKIIPAFKPTYPEYCEVRVEGAVEEKIRSLLGYYKRKEEQLMRTFD